MRALTVVLFGCTAASAAPEPRVDLTKRPQPIAATVELHGATLGDDVAQSTDSVGLTLAEPVATFTLAGIRMDISRDPATGPADAATDTRDNAKRFELVAERRRGSVWARLYRWRGGTDDCFIAGGSVELQLRCTSHTLKGSCAAAQGLLDACASLEPQGRPIAPKVDLARTFPRSDPQARIVMAAVATAIVKDDRAAFERYVAPAVAMHGHAFPARQLHAALGKSSVSAVTGLRDRDCVWSDNVGDQPAEHAAMTPDTVSYGIQHVARFARQADSTWKLVAIDDVDLGRDQ